VDNAKLCSSVIRRTHLPSQRRVSLWAALLAAESLQVANPFARAWHAPASRGIEQ
jgi:hypothetical protein